MVTPKHFISKIPIALSIFILVFLGCNSSSGDKNQTDQSAPPLSGDSKNDPATGNEKAFDSNNPLQKTEHTDTSDMVFFEGGNIKVGNNEGFHTEKPEFQTEVEPFYLDKYLVTVAEFAEFVEKTGYITDAEKYGDSGVFNDQEMRWELLKGTYWKFPFGPDEEQAIDDHPVTHVSWNDAMAYAEWAGKSLPHEFQWEYAARNGESDGTKYAWGDEVMMDGKFMANVWQGELKDPQGADGFKYTSPVGYYGETPSGVTDLGGNVWEWCRNTYKPYPGSTQPFREDPNLKVIRGGSFFYDELGDNSFTVSFRNQNSRETSLFNTGFRCGSVVN